MISINRLLSIRSYLSDNLSKQFRKPIDIILLTETEALQISYLNKIDYIRLI